MASMYVGHRKLGYVNGSELECIETAKSWATMTGDTVTVRNGAGLVTHRVSVNHDGSIKVESMAWKESPKTLSNW